VSRESENLPAAAMAAVDSLVRMWPLPADEAVYRAALADAWLAGRGAAWKEASEMVGGGAGETQTS